jgi:hypothetical protein
MQANDVTRAALETISPFVQQEVLNGTDARDQAVEATRRIWSMLSTAAANDQRAMHALTIFREEPDDRRNTERLTGMLAVLLAAYPELLAKLSVLTTELQQLAQQKGITFNLVNSGTNSGQQAGYNSGNITQHNSGPRGGVHFGNGGQFGDLTFGDIAGRDIIRTEITQGDRISDQHTGNFVGGSQVHVAGNVSGSILNIDATLSNVRQSIAAAPHGDPAAKAKLDQLTAELGAVLLQAPAAHAAAAEALAELTQTAMSQALKPQPNQLLVQVTAAALIQTAQTLAAALPPIPSIAQRLADAVQRYAAAA